MTPRFQPGLRRARLRPWPLLVAAAATLACEADEAEEPSPHEAPCAAMVTRMSDCGVVVTNTSYDQLQAACASEWNRFHQCLWDCHDLVTTHCSDFFACAYVCGGGSRSDLCKTIMYWVYDQCESDFRTTDDEALSKIEAEQLCLVDFDPGFHQVYDCIVTIEPVSCEALDECMKAKRP